VQLYEITSEPVPVMTALAAVEGIIFTELVGVVVSLAAHGKVLLLVNDGIPVTVAVPLLSAMVPATL
jgi:hypothetical protein